MALGDLVYRGASVWKRLVGNTTSTRKFLRQVGNGVDSAAPAWDQVTDADLSVSDVTTNNVTTSAHGFAPKAPNDTTKFLRGDATWAVPSGGGASALDDLTDVTITTPSTGQVLKYSGSAWVNDTDATGGGGSGPGFTPPVNGDFAWINQGTASIGTSGSGLFLQAPLESGVNLHMRKKAAPSTPYVLTTHFVAVAFDANQFHEIGVLFRESSSGKLSTYGIRNNGGSTAMDTIVMFTWSSPTAFNASYGTASVPSTMLSPSRGVWFRIADNGTSRIFSASADGYHYATLHTVSRTDYLTADEIGFYAHSNGASGSDPFGMYLLSWDEA